MFSIPIRLVAAEAGLFLLGSLTLFADMLRKDKETEKIFESRKAENLVRM